MMRSSYDVGSRRRLAAQLAVLIAAVAVANAQREAWNDLTYYDWLRRAQRGEIMLRGRSPDPVRIQGPATGTWSSGSSFTVSLSWTPGNGNQLMLIVSTMNNSTTIITVSSVSQTGVTWTFQKSGSYSGSYSKDAEIWFGVVGSNPGTNVTVNLSSTPGSGAAGVACEYTGLLTSGMLDKTASNYSSSQVSSGNTGTTATTTQNSELWVGAIGGGYSTETYSSPTNGFTIVQGSGWACYLEKIVSATGTANAGASFSPNQAYAACIATFIASPVTNINVSDTGLGSEGAGSQATLELSDSGLSVDTVLRNFTIVGCVRDSGSNPVAGATVWLFRTSDEAFIAATTSDANGNYVFPLTDTSTQYFVRAHLDSYLGDRVWGTTDRTLVAS